LKAWLIGFDHKETDLDQSLNFKEMDPEQCIEILLKVVETALYVYDRIYTYKQNS